MQNEIFDLVDQAVLGDKMALEELVVSIQDMIYNLSLRMLGSPQDAEDALQEIFIRIITSLSSFKKESAFSTWAYKVATNHLINYKKSMFANRPLSFEFYGADIENGFVPSTNDLLQNVDEEVLSEELKMSCTNVMLQCLDEESRCIYVLGIMFKADSKTCGEIFDITPEAYRQRLSRIKRKMGDFLSSYCGLSKTGKCNCQKRIGYAIQSHRLNPHNLEYISLQKLNDTSFIDFKKSMEEMDDLSIIFAGLPKYRSPQTASDFLKKIMHSENMKIIMSGA